MFQGKYWVQIPWEDVPGILDPGSQPESKCLGNDSDVSAQVLDPDFLGRRPQESWILDPSANQNVWKMIRMFQGKYWVQIPWEEFPGILDPSANQNVWKMIRMFQGKYWVQIPWEDVPGILDLASQPKSKCLENDSDVSGPIPLPKICQTHFSNV